MAFKERRSHPKPEPMPKGLEASKEPPPLPALLRDSQTGFYTMLAIREFVQYEIDGGSQTEANEHFVTPLCIAAISLDALPSLPSDKARERLVQVVGEAMRDMTRKADRLARSGNDFVALLRRTLAVRARDHYVPHLRGVVAEVCKKEKTATTLSFGISSLTEHVIREPGEMIQKAFTALDVARKQGAGSVVVYDFRTMPY